MKNEKKTYLPPIIDVIPLDAGDMLAKSGDSDFLDNWSFDVFSD